jgi:hypothetical protein
MMDRTRPEPPGASRTGATHRVVPRFRSIDQYARIALTRNNSQIAVTRSHSRIAVTRSK